MSDSFVVSARGRTEDPSSFVTDGTLILREDALRSHAGRHTFAPGVRELAIADGRAPLTESALHGVASRDLVVNGLLDCDLDRGVAVAAWPARMALCTAALTLSLVACSGGRSTPTPPTPPAPPRSPAIPSVSTPASLCDADFRETIVAQLAPDPIVCGHPLFTATYLRVGVGAHDVVLVLVADAFATEHDGPVEHRRRLVIDGERAACDATPCAALDALGASEALDDAQLEALLSIALSFEPGHLLRDHAAVESQSALWPDRAALLRARPVGLVREPAGARLHAWQPWTEAEMAGTRRRLSYRTASLASGRLRTSSETVLDDFTPHASLAPDETAGPRAHEDPLDGLGEL